MTVGSKIPPSVCNGSEGGFERNLMAYANAADPLICVISKLISVFWKKWQRSAAQSSTSVIALGSERFQYDILSRIGGFLRRLGGIFLCSDDVLKIFGAAWRRLEALCCLVNDLKASWRLLRGVLETLCRRPRIRGILEEFWRRLEASGAPL